MRHDERLGNVRSCPRRSLQRLDVECLTGMVKALEMLPDLRQSW